MSADTGQNIVVWKQSSRDYRRLGTFCVHGNVTSITMTTDRQRVIALVRKQRSLLLLLKTINI